MFKRCEQIGTETSFLFADSIEVSALQDQCEEALSEIFCLFRVGALPSYETVDRAPVGATKLFERFLCCRRFTLRLQHYAPVRGRKRDRCFVLRNRVHPPPGASS